MRYCFVLRVRPDLLGEYTERHAAVWPDMLRALRQAGWERYSLFARPDGLIVGYVEAEHLDAAQRAVAATSANTRWQADMARFFVATDDALPGQPVLLQPIFNLDDQLEKAGSPDHGS